MRGYQLQNVWPETVAFYDQWSALQVARFHFTWQWEYFADHELFNYGMTESIDFNYRIKVWSSQIMIWIDVSEDDNGGQILKLNIFSKSYRLDMWYR